MLKEYLQTKLKYKEQGDKNNKRKDSFKESKKHTIESIENIGVTKLI